MGKKTYDLNINIGSEKSIEDEVKLLERLVDARNKLKGDIEIIPDAEVKKIAEVVASEKQLSDAIATQRKVLSERQKLEQRLGVLRSENIQENEQLKVQITEQRKENKQLAREQLGLISNYDRLSKQLREQKKEVKDLLLENRALTKEEKNLIRETKELAETLKEVDKEVGDNQRNVGNYRQGLEDLQKTALSAAGAFLSFKAAQAGLTASIQANDEASKDLNGAIAQGEAILNTFANRTGSAISGLFNIASAALSGEASFGSFLSSINKVTGAYDGLVDESLNAANAAKEASDAQFEFERASLGLREQIAVLNGELERQNQIAGDTTKSFEDQEKAAQNVARLQIERALIVEDLAQRELEIIQDQIKARGEGANVIDLLNQQAEKTIELQEAQNELSVAQQENEKVLREIQRDRFERQLDFAIDAFDVQKTINERLIADDRKTLAEREKIAQQTIALANSSFQEQIQLLENQTGKQLELQELVTINDEKEIRRRLDINGVADDVTLGRILEVIKERKLALQDIADFERDLAQERIDNSTEILEAEQNIEQENLAFKKELLDEELNNEKTSNQEKLQILQSRIQIEKEALIDQADFEKEQIEREIIEEDVKAAKILEIDNKLKNDLIRAEKELAEQQEQIRQEQFNELVNDSLKVSDALSNAFAKRNEEELNQIDKEIDARDKALQAQQERAEKGLSNELELQQQRLAELDIERQKAQQKEERRQKVLSYYNLLAGYAQQDPDTALQRAAKDIALSEAITLAFAEKGGIIGDISDTTQMIGGEFTRTHTGRDRLVLAEEGEGMLSVKEMNNLGRGNFYALKDMLSSPQSNSTLFPTVPTFTNNIIANNNDAVVTEIRDLKNIIRKKPTNNVRLDNMGNVINETITDGIRHTRKIMSKKPPFRR